MTVAPDIDKGGVGQTHPTDIAAWIAEHASERAERHAARQRQRQADRAEFGRRRAAGLAARHAGKLHRQHNEPADSHTQRRTGTDPHSGTPDPVPTR